MKLRQIVREPGRLFALELEQAVIRAHTPEWIDGRFVCTVCRTDAPCREFMDASERAAALRKRQS